MKPIEKCLLPSSTQPGRRNIQRCEPIDHAAWLWHPDVAVDEPVFLQFACRFQSDGQSARIHLTADQNYVLYVDGERLVRGPDRSDVQHWSFATFELSLEAGEHEMEVAVWWLGRHAPMSVMTHDGGFALWAEGAYTDLLSTGRGAWRVLKRAGYRLSPSALDGYHVIGDSLHVDAAAWHSPSSKWATPCVVRTPIRENATGVDLMGGWKCYPSTLPMLMDHPVSTGRIRAVASDFRRENPIEEHHCLNAEIPAWQALLKEGSAITLAPRQHLAVLWDLEDYVCGFHEIRISGGKNSDLFCSWAESLFHPDSDKKGQRTEIVGKVFRGFGHGYTADGGSRRWIPYWGCSGRYLLLSIRTADEPLTVERLSVNETRYPLESEAHIDTGNDLLQGTIPICLRALQNCAHDHLMDCPYYEQMMYVGDTRLELLAIYSITTDTHLAKRCINLFDYSRRAFGFVAERYPAREDQCSTTFAAIWVLCIRDFALWRDDAEWVRERMIGARANLDCFLPYRGKDGLVENLPGWSFIDWVNEWDEGAGPGQADQCCCLSNLFYLLALQAACELETMLGSSHLAAHYQSLAEETACAIHATFWNEARGLFADDPRHHHFSQHAQCLAIIAGLIDEPHRTQVVKAMLTAPDLASCSIYFRYYLLEALFRCRADEALVAQYETWSAMRERGLYTTPETADPTRSDCHAWGSHALYHLVSSVAGIRPSSASFREIEITPSRADIPFLNVTVPHPEGVVEVALKRDESSWRGVVVIPNGCVGYFQDGEYRQECRAGRNEIGRG